MSRTIETTTATPTQRDPLQTHVLGSRTPRQSAFLAIFTMLFAVLLFNLAAYTVTAIFTSLTSTPTVLSSTKLRASDCECPLPQQKQDWLVPALSITKICFIASLMLGMTSGALLVIPLVDDKCIRGVCLCEELCAKMWNWGWNRGACVGAYSVYEEVRGGRWIDDGCQYYSGLGFDWASIWYNGVSYIQELGLEPECSREKRC